MRERHVVLGGPSVMEPDELDLLREARRLLARRDIAGAEEAFRRVLLAGGPLAPAAAAGLVELLRATGRGGEALALLAQFARRGRGRRGFGTDMGADIGADGETHDFDRLFRYRGADERYALGHDLGADISADSGEPADPGAVVRRTPHLDLAPDGPLPPGTEFSVTVYADTAPPREGEESEPIEVRFPPGVPMLTVDVWLAATPHFEVTGPERVRHLVLFRDKPRSTTATFRLRTVAAAEWKGLRVAPAVCALFACNGRPAGMVRCHVALAGPAAPPGDPPPPDRAPGPGEGAGPPPRIEVRPGARSPDLTIEIADPGNDFQHLRCKVTSPVLDAFRGGVARDWNLNQRTPDLVAGILADFTRSAVPAEILASLTGAGVELWRIAPENVRDAWSAFAALGRTPDTIMVVSAEPFVPWELMWPWERDASGIQRLAGGPLGVSCAVGRWIREDNLAPPQRIRAAPAMVVAPDYAPGKNLPKRAEELELLRTRLGATEVRPADFGTLDRAVGGAPPGLLHFTCHGVSGSESDRYASQRGARPAFGTQVIRLDGDKATLDSRQVLGMPGLRQGLGSGRPLVFLNACEIGRQLPALSGVGGFPASFASLGASAVIAPLWAVKDVVAHEIAELFYAAAEPGVPLAEVVRRIRSRAYQGPSQGEDTWAAYCFYGDPLAERDA